MIILLLALTVALLLFAITELLVEVDALKRENRRLRRRLDVYRTAL